MKKGIWILMFLFIIPISVKAETVEVSTFEQLQNAIMNSATDISITENFEFNSSITVANNVKIVGNNKTLSRNSEYKGSLFSISSGASLELNSLTIDSGSPGWNMDYENRYYTQDNYSGYVRVPTITDPLDNPATTSLISNEGDLTLNSITFQNGVCTVNGCVINGAGNNTINNSHFSHFATSKYGGVIYLKGGTTSISNSNFIGNVAGYNVSTVTFGGAIYTNEVSLFNVSDVIFEDNFSQADAGAIYVGNSDAKIVNTIFKHNMAGNDGSALSLRNRTTRNSMVEITDSVFDGNHGFAVTGQSLGTIWIGSKWGNNEDSRLIFKNLVFKNNIAKGGGVIGDNAPGTYLYFQNIEVFNNEIGSGCFALAQQADYYVDGLYVHDNTVNNSAGFYINRSKVVADHSRIINNTGTGSGIGVYLMSGSLTMKNSEIIGNTTTGARGGGIYVRGAYVNYNPSLVLENTIIKDNSSNTMGGGICIVDDENVFTSVRIDDQSKIYDNSANSSGDDFVYIRNNDSENTSSNSVTLDNISIAGISGIDGWYYDNEGDRFQDTNNPTVFEYYTGYTGFSLYLKAAGVSSIDYDLNGGINNDIRSVVIKYGQDYVVTDEQPKKAGYEFLGWNTREDGSGVRLNAGDNYDGSDGYILYAQYKIINPNTGTNIMYNVKLRILILSLLTFLIFSYRKIQIMKK